MTTNQLSKACREVASHFQGDVTAKYFDWYDAINGKFFNGALPQAFILQALTPYGKCIGLTKLHYQQPIVLLHPILQKYSDPEKEEFYTLLHEALHVYIGYVLKEYSSSDKSSHNNPAWIIEANRIAKLLGYDVILGGNKVARSRLRDGGDGTLTRISTGNVSYHCTSSFPHPLEKETGQPLPPINNWLN